MYVGLLPIGSVVRIKGEESSFMIVGYFSVQNDNPDRVWD